MNDISIRTTLKAGDLGYLIYRHGVLYSAEYGFDASFEAYVAEPVGKFARTCSVREQLWIAEQNGQAVGWIAIVKADETTAQLRWFLIEPELRGRGLGKRLMSEAIAFSRSSGYEKIILWTVPQLTAAARLYKAFGFKLIEEKTGGHCGALTREQRYEKSLTEG